MVNKQPIENINAASKSTTKDYTLKPTDTRRPGFLCHELNLRCNNVRHLVALELPVYGSDMRKVLEIVRGLPTLQHAHETKSQFLSVKLRPSEPSCKPLFADLTKTQMVLLKVKRWRHKRKRNGTTDDNMKENKNATFKINDMRFSAEVVGLVKEKYVCEGMADFQYFTARSFYAASKPDKNALTVVANGTDTVETVMISAVVEDSPLTRPSLRQRQLQNCLRPYLAVVNETQLELIPEVFSKVDLPQKYEFRQKSGYQPTVGAKKPSSTITYLNFHDGTPAPVGPKPEQPAERRRPVGVDDSGVDTHVMEMLQRKLEQKPIWLRSKLFDGLDGFERRAARRLLRKICYVFVDGPWRGSWIKMGYDPRLPENVETASRYQVVELRNNRELVHSKVIHASRKRTKKFISASSGNANGENGHTKGPRIVKVTQTSFHDNAQANKRRRKERFTRGETRRSYLVEPTATSTIPSAAPTVILPSQAISVAATLSSAQDWNPEDEQEDKESDTAQENADNASEAAGGYSEKVFEIFGVPLTSANVLFQLEEIDDDEVREWTAQFQKLSKPSLLGGWYPTQMFLPLREIIRLRIAAMVGRTRAELETRRKRLDALKKQALIDYADCRLSQSTNNQKYSKPEKVLICSIGTDNAEAAADDDGLAIEQSLLQERRHVKKLSVGAEAEKGEEDEEEEDLYLDLQGDENEDDRPGSRSRTSLDEDVMMDDDEEEEEVDTVSQKQQPKTDETSESTEYSF